MNNMHVLYTQQSCSALADHIIFKMDRCLLYTLTRAGLVFATFAREIKTSSRPSSKMGKFVESYSPILFTTGEIKENLNSFHSYLPRLLLLCIRNEANQANPPTFFLFCVCVCTVSPSFPIVGLFLDLIYSEEVNYIDLPADSLFHTRCEEYIEQLHRKITNKRSDVAGDFSN